MNVTEVLDTFQLEGRSLQWPGERLERLPTVTRRCWESGDVNMVTAFDLDETRADQAIREQVAYFTNLRRSFEWKSFSYDRPADLVERLRAAGFTVESREALVVYDLEDGFAPFEGEYDCQVVRIEREEQLPDFRLVAEEVFQKNFSLTTNELAEALRSGDEGHRGYIGYIDDIPASIGRLYTHPQSRFGGLYGGGTRKEFRSRGCYRAVIAARARDAAARGVRYVQVDAMPTSLPILLRLGFSHIADTVPCVYTPLQ